MTKVQTTETTAESLIKSESHTPQKKIYKKRWGDRKDGRRLRSLDPLTMVAPFIMPTRVESQNLFSDSVDMNYLNDFVHKKKAEGLTNFNVMHVLVAAYVRTVSQRPGINRFLSGLRIYARQDIEVNMAVKKSLALDAQETMIKCIFSPEDTVDDVYTQLNEKITEAQNAIEEETLFDKLARCLGFFPRWLLKSAIKFLSFLDYHGKLPRSLTLLSPFHGSMVLTSMGSLGIPVIYHHLYNFGNVPVFIAFSATRKEKTIDKDGSVKTLRYLDFTVTTDERICDGFYYASAFHELKKNLKNPQLLEQKPEKVIEDVD